MNKQMKQRTSLLICMAVMGVTVNAYAADVTATSSDTETHTINVTANRIKSIFSTAVHNILLCDDIHRCWRI